MKKTRVFSAILALGILLAGCSGKKEEPAKDAKAAEAKSAGGKLYIYNWTYYIPDDVLRDFEKEFKTTVVYDVFASNEEMFAKLKAGGTGYDVTFPSGDYVSIMISEGMIEKIDKAKVPNFQYIDKDTLAKIKYDPGNQYSVPYIMGTAGIAVNKKLVPKYDKSWSLFGRKDLKGRMTMLDDMREVLGAALKSLGYSVNSRNPAELEKAKKVVLGWKENIMKFDSEAFAKSFAADEFWVVQGYAENVYLELDDAKKANVDFFIAKEGGPMYMDSMVILKDSKNKDLAYQFINYIQKPEVYAKVVDYLMLPSVNVKARELIKVKPKYTHEDLKSCEFKEDLGKDLELYNKIWQEIRVGS